MTIIRRQPFAPKPLHVMNIVSKQRTLIASQPLATGFDHKRKLTPNKTSVSQPKDYISALFHKNDHNRFKVTSSNETARVFPSPEQGDVTSLLQMTVEFSFSPKRITHKKGQLKSWYHFEFTYPNRTKPTTISKQYLSITKHYKL